jgi:hypothetical protein
MRIALLVFCLVLIPTVLLDGQSEAPDPYSIGLVKFELQMRSGGRKVIHGFSQKGLVRLGDGVSDAILKILDDQELTRPDAVRNFLPIIRDSFAEPRLISIEADKTPRVTLFLLDYLKQRVNDAQTQQDIQETVDFIKTKTG